MPDDHFESAYKEGCTLLSMGYDTVSIEIHLSSMGFAEETVDAVMVELVKVRRASDRIHGTRSFLYGLSFIAVAVLFSIFIPFGEAMDLVLPGTGIIGLLFCIKGIVRFLNL